MTFVKISTSDLFGVLLILLLLFFPFLTALKPVKFGLLLSACLIIILAIRFLLFKHSIFEVLLYAYVPFVFLICSFYHFPSIITVFDEFIKLSLAMILSFKYADILGGRYTKFTFTCLSIITITINIAFSSVGLLFEDSGGGARRFLGTFGSVNLTSYVLVLMGTYLFLISRFRYSIFAKTAYVVFLCYIQVVTGTKSLFAILPFMVFLLFDINWNLISKKSAIVFLFTLTVLLIFTMSSLDYFFLVESYFSGSSLNTRAQIYEFMFLLIRETYAFIPLGVGYSDSQMMLYFSGYPIHNDFLKYLADYGFFSLFIFYIVFLKDVMLSARIRDLCLLLFVFSASLHNNLFSPYILIPFFMVKITGDKFEKA